MLIVIRHIETLSNFIKAYAGLVFIKAYWQMYNSLIQPLKQFIQGTKKILSDCKRN